LLAPYPALSPIREVLAHGDAAAREIDDYGCCSGCKGAVREDAHREVPLSPLGRGVGGEGGCERSPIEAAKKIG